MVVRKPSASPVVPTEKPLAGRKPRGAAARAPAKAGQEIAGKEAGKETGKEGVKAAVKKESPPVAKSAAPVAAPPSHGKKRKRLAKAFSRPLDKERKKQVETVVRERFSMMPGEYEQLLAIRKQLSEQGVDAKKSDLVRAGVLLLAAQPLAEILRVLNELPARP